jgi:hypothetical protein
MAKIKKGKIQMNHVEILPVLILLTKYTVATSRLLLHYVPADYFWSFDYYEKHSPKVVLTKSKKAFLASPTIPIGLVTETLPTTSLPVTSVDTAELPPYNMPICDFTNCLNLCQVP